MQSPEAVVLDLETTQKCPVGNNKANPFWPDNKIVMLGMQALGHKTKVVCPGEKLADRLTNDHTRQWCLVAHNAAFDIHYLMQRGHLPGEDLARMHIWDTQLAEYLLTGQQEKFPSLDFCSEKRGGAKKDERVSIMFDAGKGADEVPPDMLKAYLEADLDNTRKVFVSQYGQAMDENMAALMWSQMDARLATIEMTNNGMAIDKDFLEKHALILEKQLDVLSLRLQKEAHAVTGEHLDPTKPQQLATLLFGGVVKKKQKVAVGTFKNGNPKLKTEEIEVPVNGYLLSPKPEWKGESGKWSTADEVLEDLLTRPGLKGSAKLVIEEVQEYRELSKQLSTYFEGLRVLIMPDGRIHHTLNHCATVTGRLSGSEPNLQNQPKESVGEVKRAFVSRWGKDGVVVEADYGQLEMVMLAVLSGDKQLMEDIESGVDLHSALFESIHHRRPSTSERWSFKRCAFALIYGGGLNAIARQGKCTVHEAGRFRTAFYDRYPDVAAWHEAMEQHIKSLRVYEGDKDNGIPVGKSYWNSPFSNRLYVFREYVNSEEVKRWKKETTSFSPQEIKNWPVQGGATGDIVPLVLGKLFRVLKNDSALRDKCLMINTVHDSVLFDIHKDVLAYALPIIRRVMEDAPRYIEETFGNKFPLKLRVGISYGPNWFEQEEVDTTTLLLKEAA